jgi:hypothetical protein
MSAIAFNSIVVCLSFGDVDRRDKLYFFLIALFALFACRPRVSGVHGSQSQSLSVSSFT